MLGFYWNWCSVQLFKGLALYIFNSYVGKGESKQQQFNISAPQNLCWDSWKLTLAALRFVVPFPGGNLPGTLNLSWPSKLIQAFHKFAAVCFDTDKAVLAFHQLT